MAVKVGFIRRFNLAGDKLQDDRPVKRGGTIKHAYAEIETNNGSESEACLSVC